VTILQAEHLTPWLPGRILPSLMHRRSFLQARGDRRPSRPCGRARDPLPLPDFEAIVRVFLNAKPCVRPSAEEIARAAGWSARELRRSYERIDRILGSVGVGNGNAIRRWPGSTTTVASPDNSRCILGAIRQTRRRRSTSVSQRHEEAKRLTSTPINSRV